jgi:phosphate-selective porin OprO/OprP
MLAPRGYIMSLALAAALIGRSALAQASEAPNAELAELKRQVRALEEKLDKLQRRNDPRTAVPKAGAKPGASDAYAALPAKSAAAGPDAIVLMPNGRPTICTADQENCVAITSRLHFDAGGYTEAAAASRAIF